MIKEYQKGMILVFALWVLILLSIFSLYLGRGARQKALFVKRLGERDVLHLIALAGVNKAILAISKDDSSRIDSFLDVWASKKEEFKDIKIGLGRFNVFYNYPQDGTIRTMFGVVDEARKININKVDMKIIERLFEIVLNVSESEAKEFAASIIDFRDKDSNLLIPQGSAEDSYYRNLSEPYDCKDDDYESLDELLLVKGITFDIFNKIKDFITIYGDKAVNINTASEEVLSAIGITDTVIDKIVTYRKGEDSELGTEDDNIFVSSTSVVPSLSQHYSLSISEVQNLSNIVAKGFIGVSSDYFSINSEASLSYSKAKEIIECIVSREGNILFWREQ